MQELKLYDPTRRPHSWTDIVHSGQYAVFHSNIHTDIASKPDGSFPAPDEENTCLVFDSLQDAEDYCASKVQQIPDLRCDIYDHTGKSRPPMLTYVNRVYLKSPQKYANWGWVLIAGSLLCFWAERHWHGTLLIPMIVGINLVFAGLRLVYWGKGGREKRRSSHEH